ncbi:uncharacterized protein LOC128733432 [Sabethes cyaneus]|uniref:uncharacterized protein LOC128733432 n=1 Tax=Sabethes cyaneus TaxID=53552 RepID=UPI00237D4BF8|nr:uncharacterized protein LOC128733432 [Sabethes cyaneus]
MVSPSKTKGSRVAANQQQKTATSKTKVVKGSRPLVHHRFYLDVKNHKLANKIEHTIRELGGNIEFFLSKDITHFITDKEYHLKQQQQQRTQQNLASDLVCPEGTPSSYQQSPVTPTTPVTPKTPLSQLPYHHRQYVNEASPSSPCVQNSALAAAATPSASASGSAAAGNTARINTGSEYNKDKTIVRPRSRADAMLQRARQQQQQQNNNHHSSASNNRLSSTSARSCADSPCSPAAQQQQPAATNSSAFRNDRNSQSPAHLAKSWGKPIWSCEDAIKFLNKVIRSCKTDPEPCSLPKSSSSASAKRATKVQHLKGDFVKIESTAQHYRPAFQVFKKWPCVNLNAKPHNSPFSESEKDRSILANLVPVTKESATARVENSVKTTVTTNATTKQQTRQCGYCEICRIEYDVLANHIVSEQHRGYVDNEFNFEALDKLIKDSGVGVETFLSVNNKLVEELLEELVDKKEESTESVESGTGKDGIVKEEKWKKTNCESLNVAKPADDGAQEVDQKKPETTVPKVLRTYSKKSKDKQSTHAATESGVAGASGSSRSPPVTRTYAGRRSAQHQPPTTASAAPKPEPAEAAAAAETAASKSPTTAAEPQQMFGRRSAIHHHPHNTLNHHNHQKAKAAKLVQQQQQQQALLSSPAKEVTAEATPKETPVELQQQKQEKAPAIEAEANAMKVLNDNSSTSEKEKDRQLKRSVAGKMGLKGSSIKPVSHPVELLECEGLDPKNTKRISLGLRQNPKRANLNEDFTSLLDETLGPMRKPRVRRESAKRVNYSEPREDEIVSQEEIMESILLESTAKDTVSENGPKKKAGGSPKRPLDVKIRGIRWRAPSPQARPPVKSPLLYKVIEQPKPKPNKKTASPTKDPSTAGGSPSKSNKNGLIVKIRRVRQSELSLLNDEAENFMFPKKDESSEEETDEDRQTTSETGPGDYSQEVPSSDFEHRNSSMRRSAGTPAPSARKRAASVAPTSSRWRGGSPSKKQSRGAAAQECVSTPTSSGAKQNRRQNRGSAALLQDNAEYYKFPDPGSRLRFPEAPIQPNSEVEQNDGETDVGAITPRAVKGKKRGRRGLTPGPSATVTSSTAEKQKEQLLLGTRSSPTSPYQHQELLSNCGKTIINYVKGKEDGMGVFKWSNFNRNCKLIEPYRFAFERVPSLEPWYETFQRQDESSEKMYEYFGNTAYRKLPYEMGPLPPLRQNCCILNYRMKSKTPESTAPGSSGSSSTSGSTTNLATNTNDKKMSSTSTAFTTPETNTELLETKRPLSLPLKKRKLLVDADRPRKSPREHASTLAILSLLHQQQQHNRRRTFSGSVASFPLVSPGSLPPPSPIYSPKKVAIQQQKQQEADSALGDEIRSSCGSDPITEKEPSSSEPTSSRIKFDPPVLEDTYVNYKVMCQELDSFLSDEPSDDSLLLGMEPTSETKCVSIGLGPNVEPIKRDLFDIVQSCDKDPPLNLKMVSRHESIVRKIVQYDRKPRPLAAVSIKSFDGGGSLGFFKKRINRTGWPNAKKRIVTRKQQQQHQQQQQLLTVKKEDGDNSSEGVKKDVEGVEGDGSRKSSTEESQLSGDGSSGVEKEEVKQEDEDDDDDEDDEDEFEDTMTMLDDEEPMNEKPEQTISDVEELPETPKKVVAESPAAAPRSPVPNQIEEVIIPNRTTSRPPPLPSSKYVTKTTTTMTRIDYNVTVPSEEHPPSQQPPQTAAVPAATTNHCRSKSTSHSSTTSTTTTTTTTSTVASPGGGCPPVATVTVNSHHQHEDDDKECDSISSRSIFVSDDCDTTSSTLINLCAEDPLAITRSGTPASHRNSATPQPTEDSNNTDRPVSRSRINNTRHLNFGSRKRNSAGGGSGTLHTSSAKSSNMEPIVCLEKLNCSSMRTRSSSRTPVKTYKRSIFTSALVNSSGIPLKRKKKKNKHKLNGTSSSGGTSSPSCSDEPNSASSSLDCDEPPQPTTGAGATVNSNGTGTGTGGSTEGTTPSHRHRAPKGRPQTPSPLKFSPRKLRKPRGRWYRER